MKSLCITIGPDWPLAAAEFDRVGLKVDRFDAIVEDNRPLAFNKSVYACMKLAEGDELLLTEDDCMFDSQVNDLDKWIPIICGILPHSALSLHFGGNIFGTDATRWQMPARYNDCLSPFAKLYNAWQSHCTYYSPECVQYILNNFDATIMDADHMIFDEWLRTHVLNQGRSYLLNPMIAYQRPRVSAIWGGDKICDYTGAHIHGNKWLKQNL